MTEIKLTKPIYRAIKRAIILFSALVVLFFVFTFSKISNSCIDLESRLDMLMLNIDKSKAISDSISFRHKGQRNNEESTYANTGINKNNKNDRNINFDIKNEGNISLNVFTDTNYSSISKGESTTNSTIVESAIKNFRFKVGYLDEKYIYIVIDLSSFTSKNLQINENSNNNTIYVNNEPVAISSVVEKQNSIYYVVKYLKSSLKKENLIGVAHSDVVCFESFMYETSDSNNVFLVQKKNKDLGGI